MLVLEHMHIVQGDFSLRADAVAIHKGQIAALLGPSGEGKSTLLMMLAGFLDPLAGRITWAGHDLGGMPPAERPVAMIFQDNNLLPHLSAYQNVALGVRPDLRLGADDKARVAAAIARVGLAGFDARLPAKLSGGQQGRLALARVLVQDRALWLLDEPFAALGPALRRDMLTLVRETAHEAGATVLMVTHAPDDVRAIADCVALVAGGTVAAPVATAEIFANPPQALQDYLG